MLNNLTVSFATTVTTCITFLICCDALQVGRIQAGPIELSRIGCGTWSWGNRLLWDYDPSQDEEIYKSYKFVRDAGVTVFDTADSYGTLDLNGRAEILLGQFELRYLEERKLLRERKSAMPWFEKILDISKSKGSIMTDEERVNKQQVATKFAPYPWRITRGSLLRSAKDSLDRLGQEKLAIAQLHWSTSKYQPLQEGALWEGLADVYDAGLCEAVGVSNYGPVQLSRFADRMQQRGVPLASAQIQYSLMTYRDAKDMNSACDNVGCRLISYSPLCLGLLTGKYNLERLPRAGNPRRQLFLELLPGARDLLATLDAVAKDYDKSQSQVAINWALCKGTVPIPGVRNLSQAEENLGATGWMLRRDAIEELDRVASSVKKPMIQNIFQTK